MTYTFHGCASITDSQRIKIINKDWSQGPATYNPKLEDHERIPKWTLKPKLEQTGCFSSAMKNKNPGPNHYNPYKSSEEFSKKHLQQKNKMHKTDILNKSLKSDRENQRKREQAAKSYQNLLKKNASLLNKNTKNNPPKNDAVSASFGYRDDVADVFKPSKESPGPVYNVSSDIKKKNGCRWGKSFQNKQNLSPNRKSEFSPGPGNYFTQTSASKTGNNWSIGKAKRGKLEKNSTGQDLGPGTYSPQLLSSSKSCTFKSKYIQNLKLGFDYHAAPGSYEIPDTKSKKGTIFKNGQTSNVLDMTNEDESPSPFSYNINSNISKNDGFSLGKRLEIFQNKVPNPGPGTYEIIEEQLLAGRKSKQGYNKRIGGYMGRKVGNQKKKMNQSQDNFYKYNPNINVVSHESPKFSFSQCDFSASQRQNSNQAPSKLGPGSYDITNSSALKMGQSYTVPKNQRFKPIKKQNEISINKVSNEPLYGSIGYIPKYLINSKNLKKNSTNNYCPGTIEKSGEADIGQ